MPRIDDMMVRIETGSKGTEGPVSFAFNGHTVPFASSRGATGPGEVFEGAFQPRSFAHSVALNGPETGEWHLKRVTVTYSSLSQTWTVGFGPATLDAETALDIWEEPPLPTWEV